jgi:hypothetical protein
MTVPEQAACGRRACHVIASANAAFIERFAQRA